VNNYGILRAAVVSPELQVANIDFNLNHILATISELSSESVNLIVFPELCITGYSCGDLFYQDEILSKSLAALNEVAIATKNNGVAVAVGLPIVFRSRLYNCVAFIACGMVVGIVPKTILPSTKEYYEERWFTSGGDLYNQMLDLDGDQVPFGRDLLFTANNITECILCVEVCEDLWSPQPPSSIMSLEGATIIINASASNELIGKHRYRRDLVKQQSARCNAAYLYSGAGPGESTTDTVCGGHSLIAENGIILEEVKRFQFNTQVAVADIDLQQLINERIVNSGFSSSSPNAKFRIVKFDMPMVDEEKIIDRKLQRTIYKHPFVPFDKEDRTEHCQEIVLIQTTGLMKRLYHTGIIKVVIGVSGGLDSTLALLIAVNAFKTLDYKLEHIIAVTMEGFGTSDRTRSNASNLIKSLGVMHRDIDIMPAVLQHFDDIGHDKNTHNVTYENSQARERTQILMDIANQVGGLVLGTGDMSELALGWCTYNGDQMSMYNVNVSVPKTLVRTLIEWYADENLEEVPSLILKDICDTPITPELLPLGDNAEINQITEDIIGPYELNDFFLFYMVRHQFNKQKIVFLAHHAFEGKYSLDELNERIIIFYKRFFSQQYKRSAMPDGPKVGSVALSPRGDWRMPSDVSLATWS
jgi:NAD+ synthase (glutamine-hydrolysing)